MSNTSNPQREDGSSPASTPGGQAQVNADAEQGRQVSVEEEAALEKLHQTALRHTQIKRALQNSLAAIAGQSIVPYPEVKAGQDPRRSTSLLGLIHNDAIYGGQDLSVQRFQRLRNPPEPIDDLPIFIEVVRDGRKTAEEADYILFSKETDRDRGRDWPYKILGVETPGYMLRVPMMEGYWVLGGGVGPQVVKKGRAASPANPAAEHKKATHAQTPFGQPKASALGAGLIVLAIAFAVSFLKEALSL